MKFRVVKITNNIEDYPDHEPDTLEFPELVEYVDDEADLFVVAEDERFWPADEFFRMVTITSFEGEVTE